MKSLYLGTNLKMYKTPQNTQEYLTELSDLLEAFDKSVRFFVIPSFPALQLAIQAAGEKSRIRLGVQNIHWEPEGPFTGEVSAPMIKSMGNISIIEIGHSERRTLFGETPQITNLKVKTAIKYGFTALLCIGEDASDKDFGIGSDILRMQLKIGLSGVSVPESAQIWVAYEPVWSIGVNGKPADPCYVQMQYLVIRKTLVDIFGPTCGKQIPILYGGSVNNDNACALIAQTDVDGLFIGRAAWDAKNFAVLSQIAFDEWKRKYGCRHEQAAKTTY